MKRLAEAGSYLHPCPVEKILSENRQVLLGAALPAGFLVLAALGLDLLQVAVYVEGFSR